jgi:pilus assembly protein CpaE
MSMSPLTAALVISSRQLWEQAHACIQNLPVRIALEQHEPEEADALLDRLERHRVDVVLLELKDLTLPLDEFIRRTHDTVSQPAVFVLHPDASPSHILESLRAGAREFLYPPLTATLREAFERLAASRSKGSVGSAQGLGRVMGFLSAKGGCGATTFACHVAADAVRGLAKKGEVQPTLLADFDMEAGLLRFLMKSKSTWSVRDALENLHRMDSSFWDKLVSKHGPGLHLISAPEDLAARGPVGAQEVAHLLRFMRSAYPLTIIDFGRHYSDAALDSIPELDTLYVLSTGEPDVLRRAKECARAFSARGFDTGRIRFLVNRRPERGAPAAQAIAEQLGTPATALFSNDYVALYDAWSEGRLLQPNTRLGKELAAFAAEVVMRMKGEPEPKPNPKAQSEPSQAGFRKFFSFFQKATA